MKSHKWMKTMIDHFLIDSFHGRKIEQSMFGVARYLMCLLSFFLCNTSIGQVEYNETQEYSLCAGNARSRISVSGDRAIIGAPWCGVGGEVYILERNPYGQWLQMATITTPPISRSGDQFGYDVSISGDIALVSDISKIDINLNGYDPYGVVFVYERNAQGQWIQQAELIASDYNLATRFGWKVDLSGESAIIGCPSWSTSSTTNTGKVYIFERNAQGLWVEHPIPSIRSGSGYHFGQDVAIDGDTAIVGAWDLAPSTFGNQTGEAHVYQRNNQGEWILKQTLVPAAGLEAGDNFGWSVSISSNTAVIGAPSDGDNSEGAAYVFERDGSGTWNDQVKWTLSNSLAGDQFGYKVVLNKDTAVVSDRNIDIAGVVNAGCAYSYSRDSGGQWNPIAKFVRSSPVYNEQLSVEMDASENTVFLSGINASICVFDTQILTGRIIRVSGDLDFGEVVVGQSQMLPVYISNPSDNPLLVSDVLYPPGFSGDWSSGSISAGSTQTVIVSFSPSTVQDYGGDMIVQSDATSGLATHAISGSGITYWTVTFDPSVYGIIATGTNIQAVKSGTAAVAPGVTADPGWIHAGWDVDFSSVSENMTVTALYDPKPLVVFSPSVNGNITSGVVSQYVFYGESAVAPGVTADPDSLFMGWNIGYTNVTQDILVTARYEGKPLVSFSPGAHGIITSGNTNQYLVSGQNAVAPTVLGDPEWHFIGWDMTFTNVVSNLVVTAQYVPKPLVVFDPGAYGIITSGSTNQYLVPGDDAIEPTLLPFQQWHFTGWDQAFTNVFSNLVVTAQYVPKPLVIFDAGTHGTIISGSINQYIIPGAPAIAPGVQAETYWHFTGWDMNFSSVTSSMTVTAQYLPYLTVTFDAGDHGVITSGNALQRVVPGGSATQPTITPDEHWTHTSWDGSRHGIQQDVTITAQYSFTMPGVIFHDPIDVFTSAPSYVTASFRLTDLHGHGLDIPASMVKAPNFFTVLEDGSPISSTESFLQVDKMAEIEDAKLQTVLMIDNSFSVFPQLADVKAAAKTIVNNAVDNQEFAVYSFSGPATNLVDFTADKVVLINAIDSIGLGSPSTDLHGSMITGLSRWQDNLSTNEVRRGFLVVLTDGDDQAGLFTTNDVLNARGDKQVFTIGLGNDVNMPLLQAFGNAGSYHVPNIADLPGVFLQIQRSIVNDANSFYWLQYVSPKRGNNFHTLNATITSNPYTGPGAALDVSFNSNGFYDEDPRVMVNRGVFSPHGIPSIVLTNSIPLELNPFTILGLVDSSYSWQVADTSIAHIVTSGGQIEIEALGNGTTTLLLTDVPNEAWIPGFGYYTALLPITVSNLVADIDMDGIPDAWEQQIVNASGGLFTSVSQVNPNDDFDGDGQSNLEEYIAGIDPTDPSSRFVVNQPVPWSGGFPIVTWNAVQGRLYGVYWTDSLMNSFQTLQTDIPYPVNSYTDTVHAANSGGFYEIDVKLK